MSKNTELVGMEMGVDLQVVLDQLRTDLIVAQDFAKDKDLKFAIDGIEVELQVVVTKEGKAGAKLKVLDFFELGAGGSISRAQTQTIRLKLQPRKGKGKGKGAQDSPTTPPADAAASDETLIGRKGKRGRA